MIVSSLAAAASGCLVGFSLGLIGGGGSILATPLLIYAVGVKDVHTAIGTGALAVSANAYLSLIMHAVKGHVYWRPAAIFAAVGAAGALVGSSLGKAIDGLALLSSFAILMLIVAALMLRRSSGKLAHWGAELNGKAYLKATGIALLAGGCSGFFGIGGGFLIVPGLMFAFNMPMLNAIGTSLFAVGTFGLTTAVNYATSGMVDWAVAAEFILGGVVGGTAGMLLCVRLSVSRTLLTRLFSAIIACVAVYILAQDVISAAFDRLLHV